MIEIDLKSAIFKHLAYSSNTGVFLWRTEYQKRTSANKYASRVGKFAGDQHPYGYLSIYIVGYRSFMAHKLAFVFMTHDWPKGIVDHINRDPSDNRWCNLRDTNQTQNMYNTGNYGHNTSGFKGVGYDRWTNRWISYIQHKGKYINLGRFDNIMDAVAARAEADKRFMIS